MGCLFPADLRSATIIASAEQDNGISSVDGSELETGNQVRVGTFDISDAEIQAHASDLVYLSQHFITFGMGQIGQTYPGVEGHFSITMQADSIALGLAGAQIYIWAFKTTTNLAPNTSYSNVTEHGIFYADDSLVPRWRIRAEGEIPNTTNIDLSDLTNPAGTQLNASAHILVGSFGTGTSSTFPGKPNFSLASVIPEPAAIGLLLLSALGFAARRWR